MSVADPCNATLVARQDLNEELALFHVRPDGGIPPFKPGQFATLGLPRPPAEPHPLRAGKPERVRLVRRAYSIASAPQSADLLEFLIVIIREGRLTPLLWDLPVGGRLYVDPEIKGEFTLDDVPNDRRLVLISTGTGSAPFVSMVRTFGDTGRWSHCVLVNGVRHSRDLAYREELEARARLDPAFVYVPLVSRPADDPDWNGRVGRVQSLLEPQTFQDLAGRPLDPADTHVFLCGNPAMIEQTQAWLQEQGFRPHSRKSPGNIHFERYW